ncbi:DUF3991 and TOPRIM domain-containing protein [Alteribacillus bidgolensis]|uniref:DUF3991 domain-containing protein n=1 Tax=Alteribacillus bidgolensis TaxID=930129 RepID=A0A1G8Q6Q6_9BACI|nr:DUF3991 and TOPRIM domain-containing protein [Alteribacillus bidgolensis]SDJ00472.1 Protein of unknown function [Alteribacillus bidgolensis]
MYRRKNTARVTTDEINQAKSVSVLDFIDANGIDVKREGRGSDPYFRLVDHDSLVIKGEKFFWNSRQEGGHGAISFAMTYYDLNFPEAVKRINEHAYAPSINHISEVKKEPFRYPHYFEVDNTEELQNYLVNDRKIDQRVVNWCIEKDLIVQDKKANVVFKWKDMKGNIIGADRQGTQSMDNKKQHTFKQIVPNSAETGGFMIDVGKNIDKVAIFESPIDLLSYWSVKKGEVQNTRLKSMSGLKEQSLMDAIKELNQNGQDVTKVISCVDNDEAGNHFHERLSRLLKKGALEDQRPTRTKDWNEEWKHLQRSKENSKNLSYGM